MNSVSGLKQLLIGKGIPNAESVNSFSKLKELVNLAHSNRVPREEEYQSGPRRAIKKTYCSGNSVSGYETSTGKAGLNGMTNFLKTLPDLKSINKTEHQTELACPGLMIPVTDCQARSACTCNNRDGCDCVGDCAGKGIWSCNCKSRCSCNGRTNPDCGARTTCTCYTVAVADDVKLCTCDSVVTY